MANAHLNDLDIIRLFLAENESLITNENLSVESTLYARQLLDRRRQVIASLPARAPGDKSPKLVSVRRKSDFWALVHQVLQEAGFIPSDKLKQSDFVSYQQRDIPKGYKLNLTEARVLWRNWWTRQRLPRQNFGLELDLLILTRDNWYPVQDIASNQGTLFIKTLVGEIALQGNDQVQWLERQVAGAATMPHPIQRRSEVQPTTPAPVVDSGPRTVIQEEPVTAAVPPPRAADYPVRTASSPVPPTPSSIPPEWQGLIRMMEGKVYVKTELGYVLIEGTGLKVSVRRQAEPGGTDAGLRSPRTKADFMNTPNAGTTGNPSYRRPLFM